MHNVNRNRVNAQEQSRRRNRSSLQNAPWPGAEEIAASTQNVDLNHATVQQLAEVISEAEARALVAYRTFHGHFLHWDDLKRVPGLSEACLEELQHAARIGGPSFE